MADVDSQGGPSHMLGRMWAMMEDVSDGKTKAHGRRLRGGREKMVLTPPSSKSSTVKHPNTKSPRKITLPCIPQHPISPDVCRKVHAAQAKDRSSVSAVNTSSTAHAVTTYEIPPQYHLPHPCSALSSLVIFHSLTLRSFPD